jgi:hypothetical protein
MTIQGGGGGGGGSLSGSNQATQTFNENGMYHSACKIKLNAEQAMGSLQMEAYNQAMNE